MADAFPQQPIPKGRVVVDVRGLNKIVEFDIYPISLQEDMLAFIAGCKYISAFDATKFFYQWRVHPEDQQKLSIVSYRGQEMYKVAVMGFCNSVAYVQRQMDNKLREFRHFARTYIDDLVVASKTEAEHEQHLHAVFSRLQQLNISLNPHFSR